MERVFVCVLLLMACGSLAAHDCRCTPDQFEGWVYTLSGMVKPNGTPLLWSSTAYLSYDYTNARVACTIDVIYNHGPPVSARILELTEHDGVRIQYTIDLRSHVCAKKVLAKQMERFCLPGGLPYTYTMGVAGELLKVKSVTYTEKGPKHEYTSTTSTSMTRDHCAPVGDIMVVKRNGEGNSIRTGSYNNVTLGIADTKVFHLPAICKHPHKGAFEHNFPHPFF